MTGQQFLDALQQQIVEHDQIDKEYNAADLTRDASVCGLWYRKPHPGDQYEEERKEAIREAKNQWGDK